ncbi:hypothetical protein [Asinibacterium sp. OR53]|jgi:hypothetical protein|uniref:hypothetical protein n=1 Tax=Asinibacterium sp. OR53 TaxID=925409 RepID=UPI00047DA9C6|nr:hypothetical protein [Asinibacterium sp. OR53]
MSDKNLFVAEKISVVDFKLVKGQVDIPEDFDPVKIEGHHVDNSLELGFNLDDKLIKSDFIIDIKTESKGVNKIEANANFHFVFIFHIENMDDLAKLDKSDRIILDPLLANALSSITYSTSRGILLTRLQGTALQGFILPVIDANVLLHPNKKE